MGRGEPVIAVTAHVYESEIKKAMDAGFDSLLTKPLKKTSLLDEIKKYIKT